MKEQHLAPGGVDRVCGSYGLFFFYIPHRRLRNESEVDVDVQRSGRFAGSCRNVLVEYVAVLDRVNHILFHDNLRLSLYKIISCAFQSLHFAFILSVLA